MRFIFFSAAIGFIAAAFWIGAEVSGVLYQGYRSRNWSITEGVIGSSSVDTRTRRGSQRGFRFRRGFGFRGAASFPNVKYSYKAAGKSYAGDKIQFGLVYNRSYFKKLYPVGARVDVFYDPDKPEVSVLKTGVSWEVFFPVGLILLFASGAVACIGVAMFYYGRH
jgi:hypothetical protein